MEYDFRPLNSTRAGCCADFDARIFAKAAWPETVWAGELSRKDALYLALFAPPLPHQSLGRLIALGGVGFGIEAEILTIAVDCAYRRRGIARALLSELISAAYRQGAAEIFLEVRSSDLGAQRLYNAAGFDVVGLRKKYYPDDDALVMRKIFCKQYAVADMDI